jgi:site-specific DNA-cytosine methylase
MIELCCGYGGASQGIMAAGHTITASYDIWPTAVETHRLWHPNVPCEVRDVATIEPDELAGHDVWASLPCQGWSSANRSAKRGKSHPSYYSLAHFAYQVQHARVAILENVPGLLHEKDGQAELKELEKACERFNLSLSINLLPSAWYGVPQLRRRAIIVIGAPLTLFSQAQLPSEALQDAPRATFGGGRDSGAYRSGLQPAPTASEGKGRHVAPDGSWSSQQKQQLALTVTSSEGNTRHQRFAGSGTSAIRSPAECALLQGVPIHYIEHLPAKHQYTLIGNAVPPRFAEGVCRAVFGGKEVNGTMKQCTPESCGKGRYSDNA